ncbi:hypothetical protein V9T40_001037 [Parthenolecanium corni]|uniref:Probable arginine--tRNA ligase, cytoplasmic n=1 Tax=Parthenolecanium corni TaxID=536013 RepID=A0AAN9Y2B0_9HEMI
MAQSFSEEILEKQELESQNLQDQVDSILKQLENKNVQNDEQLAILEVQNTKLKHRLAILKKAIVEESKKGQEKRKSDQESDDDQLLLSPRELLTNSFIRAVSKAYPEVPSSVVTLTPTSNPKFGDYQCNAAMPICQQLKAAGKQVNPRVIAQNILNELSASEVTEKVEIAGAGFINVWLNKSFVCNQLSSLLLNDAKPPPPKKKLKIVVDYSSPNVAKEMHVGHLRSTIIGDSISNLLEYMGHDVLRLNHIGDWGTQFGMLIAHLQDMFPNYRTESPSVGNLQRFYKESKIRFDTDEEFKKRAKESVVKLQKKVPDYIQAWKLICDASRKEFQKIYDRLDIIKLVERGESFYQERMLELVNDLTEKNLLEDDDGRKILWGEEKKEGEIPFTIVKSDGGFTYDTSDLSAFKQRIVEEKGDWIIYVVDEGQSTHFQCLVNCARKCGIYDPEKVRMDFVGFGVVLGEDKKKFKTRSGDTVRLANLLDEGVRRATEKLEEKNRHTVLTEEELNATAEALAYGCIKYADLSHNRNHVYVFSFDKMLDDKGNTAIYLLYAYTRIKSISRTAKLDIEVLKKACREKGLTLDHEKEWKLAKVLLQFNDVLQRITKDLNMHRLCEFLYEVAVTFSEFYDNCYCIERDAKGNVTKVHVDRIILCEVTALIMKKCFEILGIRTVSRM